MDTHGQTTGVGTVPRISRKQSIEDALACRGELPEKGSAGIIVELSGSVITVRHQDSPKTVLLERVVTFGAWTRLWKTLEELR